MSAHSPRGAPARVGAALPVARAAVVSDLRRSEVCGGASAGHTLDELQALNAPVSPRASPSANSAAGAGCSALKGSGSLAAGPQRARCSSRTCRRMIRRSSAPGCWDRRRRARPRQRSIVAGSTMRSRRWRHAPGSSASRCTWRRDASMTAPCGRGALRTSWPIATQVRLGRGVHRGAAAGSGRGAAASTCARRGAIAGHPEAHAARGQHRRARRGGGCRALVDATPARVALAELDADECLARGTPRAPSANAIWCTPAHRNQRRRSGHRAEARGRRGARPAGAAWRGVGTRAVIRRCVCF